MNKNDVNGKLLVSAGVVLVLFPDSTRLKEAYEEASVAVDYPNSKYLEESMSKLGLALEEVLNDDEYQNLKKKNLAPFK